MRRIFVYILMPFLFSTPAFADLADTIRSCVESARKTENPSRRKSEASTCLNRASRLTYSSQLFDRAVYFQALYLKTSTDIENPSPSYISSRVSYYYNGMLQRFLVPLNFRNLSDTRLTFVHEASYLMARIESFVSGDRLALDKMLLSFSELQNRKMVTDKVAQEMYSVTLQYRDWNESRQILRRWPDLKPRTLPNVLIQDVLTKDEPGFYSMSADLQTFTQEAYQPKPGPEIIMIAGSPQTLGSFQDLAAESEILSLMSQYGFVLGSPEYNDWFEQLEWSKAWPELKIHPAVSATPWSKQGVDFTTTPAIYFKLDGVMRLQLIGWGMITPAHFCVGLGSIELPEPGFCRKQSLDVPVR